MIMYRNFIKPIGLFAVLTFVGLFASCQQEEAVSADIDNFVLLSTRGIEVDCGAGIAGCYELVFPVTIQFSDGSTVEVADYASLKQAIRDWFVANGGRPNFNNRPKLVFPLQVINPAGEIIPVETPEAMKELLALCRPALGGGHHGGGGPDSLGGGHHNGPTGACFTLVFPVNISFPDGTTITVNSPRELAQAAFNWNKNNPGQHARPEIIFPVTVTLRDGSQVIVNSKEELQAIKDTCRG